MTVVPEPRGRGTRIGHGNRKRGCHRHCDSEGEVDMVGDTSGTEIEGQK